MIFEAYKDILLSDTLVPDVFMSDILPGLPPECVKVYLYCLFLSKYRKKAEPIDIAKRLGLPEDTIKSVFVYLENEKLIVRSDKGIILVDIKEREVNKLYRKKTTSSVEQALANTEQNIKRNQCIDSINQMFFMGMMSPTWYTQIDQWFAKYHFDADVMVSLFKHCYDNNGLHINYVEKVAENWYSKGIITHFDLEEYMENYQKLKTISRKIKNALRRHDNLTQYEEELLENWITKFGYSFEVIEFALKETTKIPKPNFKYIDKTLENWHKAGLKTAKDVENYLKNKKQSRRSFSENKSKISQINNFKQREYDDELFNKLDRLGME